MISFNIRCSSDHVFEAWFPDGKAFDRQSKQGKVACPVCGDCKVEKAPMAPNIARGKSRGAGRQQEFAKEMASALRKLRREVEANCDYVGNRFAEEARKIHYDETEPRNIYGETTAEEAAALKEEGVEFARIPWAQQTEN